MSHHDGHEHVEDDRNQSQTREETEHNSHSAEQFSKDHQRKCHGATETDRIRELRGERAESHQLVVAVGSKHATEKNTAQKKTKSNALRFVISGENKAAETHFGLSI